MMLDEDVFIQFYADDGFIGGLDHEKVQKMLDIMEANFKKFGLLMNNIKTESMIMLGSKPVHRISDDAYERMVPGNGKSYDEKAKTIINCELCNMEIQQRSKKRHQLSNYCRSNRNKTQQNDTTEIYCLPINEEISNTIILSMKRERETKCKYDFCSFKNNKPDGMRRHFRSRHPNDIIIIEEEGLLPQCELCGLFQKNVHTEKHRTSADCKHFQESKMKRKQETMQQSAKSIEFFMGGRQINKVKIFKYLGRMITDEDDDLPAMELQLKKARGAWGRIGKILKKKTKSNPKVMATFYKVIIQSILLYGSESWIMNDYMKAKLNSFHRRCSRYITGRHIRLVNDVWIYPESKMTLEMADLDPIESYIKKRRDTISAYVHSLDLYNVCKGTKASARFSNQLVWWKNYEKEKEEEIDVNQIVIEISDENESGNSLAGE